MAYCPRNAAQPLEGYGPNEWVSFERALVVRDIFTGGVRTFLNRADAQDFRASLYSQYGVGRPSRSWLLALMARMMPWLLCPIQYRSDKSIEHLLPRIARLCEKLLLGTVVMTMCISFWPTTPSRFLSSCA